MANGKILQAALQIRFETSINNLDEMVNVLYKGIVSDNYNFPIPTPFKSLPKIIIENDKSLKYNPIYTINSSNNKYQIVLGHYSINFTIINNTYERFGDLIDGLKKINEILKTFFPLKKDRLGLQFDTFFENTNIYDIVNIDMKNKDRLVKLDENLIFTDKIDDNTKQTFILSNAVVLANNPGLINSKGSVLNMDTFSVNGEYINTTDTFVILNSLYNLANNKFTDLLKQNSTIRI